MSNRQQRRAEAKQNMRKGEETKRRIHLMVERAYSNLDTRCRTEYEGHRAQGMIAEISCKQGCNHCCYQFITVTLPEAAFIASRFPRQARDAMPTLLEQEARMAELGIQSVNLGNGPEREAFAEKWWHEHRPCAFLQNGLCSIYEARPLACRTYFSVDDPERCASMSINTIKGWMPLRASIAAVADLERAGDGLAPGRVIMGPFQSLLLYIVKGST